MIRIIFREGRNFYGTKRIKLMKEANLVCRTKRKFKATTDSNNKFPVVPNLLARQVKS